MVSPCRAQGAQVGARDCLRSLRGTTPSQDFSTFSCNTTDACARKYIDMVGCVGEWKAIQLTWHPSERSAVVEEGDEEDNKTGRCGQHNVESHLHDTNDGAGLWAN